MAKIIRINGLKCNDAIKIDGATITNQEFNKLFPTLDTPMGIRHTDTKKRASPAFLRTLDGSESFQGNNSPIESKPHRIELTKLHAEKIRDEKIERYAAQFASLGMMPGESDIAGIENSITFEQYSKQELAALDNRKDKRIEVLDN
jgi:hypothetical protein